MAMKEWVRKFQPLQLYIILILTTIFFITEMVVSHLTHALTLLMDSYQMLCNILAMVSCIITVKYSKNSEVTNKLAQSCSISSEINQELKQSDCSDKPMTNLSPASKSQESKLKNTFGWARIDVIGMLTCCIFQMSLSFSVFVESIQTLAHIDHFDEMHQSLSVLCLGSAGLLLNGVCYLLIGGYTFHQGSFLFVTKSGDVVLNKIMIGDTIRQGGRRLSRTRTMPQPPTKERQGFKEMCKDVIGCIFVIICALLVYFTDKNIAKFVDPIMSTVLSLALMFLSYPYLKESCLILLQTIPASVDIDMLKKDLLSHFPGIVNVHDFHVWQLTASKVISTVHVIFQHKRGYNKMLDDIKDYFMENGITHVTIQPEFFTKSKSMENLKTGDCLMQCQGEGCKLNHCCPSYEDEHDPNKFKSKSKSNQEQIPRSWTPDLKSIKVVNNELSLTPSSLANSEQNIDNTVKEDVNPKNGNSGHENGKLEKAETNNKVLPENTKINETIKNDISSNNYKTKSSSSTTNTTDKADADAK